MHQKPLTDKQYVLEKFAGKGGWTFVRLPEIAPDRNRSFGWVRVSGHIDSFEISGYHLQPMGNGSLFLPVMAEIRKKIRKTAGDSVHVVLYADVLPDQITEELQLCFKEEPGVYEAFMCCTSEKQQRIIRWIYSAHEDSEKAERIVKTMNDLLYQKR